MLGPSLNSFEVKFGWNKLITFSKTIFLKRKNHTLCKVRKETKLPVSGRSSECYDCLFRCMEHKNFKTNIKNIMNFFFQIEIFVKFITPHAV